MKMLPWPGPFEPKVTFGSRRSTSSKVATDSWLSWSPVIAWIVIGTFWMDSERRCAVTTISSRPPVASAARADAEAVPSTAAIATAKLFLLSTSISRIA